MVSVCSMSHTLAMTHLLIIKEELDRPYFMDPMPNTNLPQKLNMPRQGVVKFNPDKLNDTVDAILTLGLNYYSIVYCTI